MSQIRTVTYQGTAWWDGKPHRHTFTVLKTTHLWACEMSRIPGVDRVTVKRLTHTNWYFLEAMCTDRFVTYYDQVGVWELAKYYTIRKWRLHQKGG